MTTYWVTTGQTDSGDTIHPILWFEKPEYEDIMDQLKVSYPSEFIDGDCYITFETVRPIIGENY